MGTDLDNYYREPYHYSSRGSLTKAYHAVLATLADDILGFRNAAIAAAEKTSNFAKTFVVVFGILERIHRRRNWGCGLRPVCFVESRVSIMGSEQRSKMEQIESWVLRRHSPHDASGWDIDCMVHEIGKYEAGHDNEDGF